MPKYSKNPLQFTVPDGEYAPDPSDAPLDEQLRSDLWGKSPAAPYDFLPANDANRENSQALSEKAQTDDYGKLLETLSQGNFVDRTPTVPQAPAPSATPAPTNQPDRQVAARMDAVTSTAPAEQPDVRDYLAKKYGFGDDIEAVKKAQAEATDRQNSINLARAFAGLNSGVGSSGRVPVDDKFYEDLGAQTQQPVKNLLQLRALKEQGLKNEGEIDALVHEKESSDPNSKVSKAAQSVYGSIMKQWGMPAEVIGASSASDIDKFLKSPLEVGAKLKEAFLQHQAQMATANNYKLMGFGQHAQSALNTDQQFKDSTTQISQTKDALAKLELSKTDPVAYSMLPIEVVRGLVKGRLNDRELRAASGGQDVDSFIERALTRGAKGTITDRDAQGFYTMLRSALDHASMDREAAIDRHAHQLSKLTNMPKDQARSFLVPDAPPAPQGTKAPVSPQDQQAVEWAKANPTDARAQKILKLNGII